MPGKPLGTGKTYLKIVSGNIVQQVEPETEGVRKRTLEDGTVKYEKVYQSWEGTIQGITFNTFEYEGKKIRTCKVELNDAVLSLNVDDRYFQDFACKVFNGNLAQPFTFHPYSISEDGRTKKGISLQQDGVKLMNHFYDGEKNLHGFPEPEEGMKSKEGYWQMYFKEVANFLVDKLGELKFNHNNNAPSEEDFKVDPEANRNAKKEGEQEFMTTDLPF